MNELSQKILDFITGPDADFSVDYFSQEFNKSNPNYKKEDIKDSIKNLKSEGYLGYNGTYYLITKNLKIAAERKELLKSLDDPHNLEWFFGSGRFHQ